MNILKIYSENSNKAFTICKNNTSNSIIWVFNRAFNPLTGSINILDIYIYNSDYQVLDWIYGVEAWDDTKISFPEYTFDFLYHVLNRIFFDFDNIYIGNKDILGYIKIPIKEVRCKEIDYKKNFERYINNSNESEKRSFFEIIFLKMNMFHNYMDTDSISFYLKDIAVNYRNIKKNDLASFYSKKAYKMNKNNSFLEEMIISLNKNKEYKDVIKLKEIISSVKGLKELGYAYKMLNLLEESLEVNIKAYNKKEEKDIMYEIEFLKKELNER